MQHLMSSNSNISKLFPSLARNPPRMNVSNDG